MRIIALHGFLGRPSDWSFLNLDYLLAIDLFAFHPSLDLWGWATEFNRYLSQLTPQPTCLMGYSLGGRLALHALIQNPSLWQCAIIISAHPGLTDKSDKISRRENDQQWAERFRKDSWTALMSDWNQRQVFAQDQFIFQRLESDYQREDLAYALDNWSLGKQDNLRASIQALPFPILWIAGEKDAKYKELAHSLSFKNSNSTRLILPQAGHRLPWEQPHLFKEHIQAFIK